MSEPPNPATPATDLEACSREPIHIPGAIQPHGALLVARPDDGTIVQVSTNTADFLGRAPAELLGKKLGDVLPPKVLSAIASNGGDSGARLVSIGEIVVAGQTHDASAHWHDGALLIELETPTAPGKTDRHHSAMAQQHRRLMAALADLRAARDLPALCASAAHTVAELTGFERVMTYRFNADWHGEVLGEALLNNEVDSYLGLHFPASDIPEQARALYAKNRLRLIPRVDYTPVGLEPPLNPLTGRPLDLSFASLRSVSPVHLEYLRNMEVGASMSISLLVDGRLWGLIACHHRTPRPLSAATRAACELFGEMVSAAIVSLEESQRFAGQAQAQRVQTRFFDVIAQADKVFDALVKYTPQLLGLMQADGAAIWVNEQCTCLGVTPGEEEVSALVRWLETQTVEPLFATDALSALFPRAASYQKIASGLLAVKLSRVEPHFVLWFRPEVVTTVTWAGNPEKPVEAGARIHPRKSFASWQQTVTGRSQPWEESEQQAAGELQLAINALVLRRSERLLKLNAELEQKNIDLNSFSYIAAHDVQEPIRGIYNFGRFLREDCGAQLDAEGQRKLDTIISLAERTEELLEALLHFSRVGRIDLHPRNVPLDGVVDEALELLGARLRESGVEIRRPHPLPTMACDRVLVREVFTNLISNASKYNARPHKWIEIGVRSAADASDGGGDAENVEHAQTDGHGPILYVRDNGIGIREKHYDDIFHILRRLHGREEFGGGSGAGLAIAKSIVERHGGRIWVESTYREGTVFFFTLK